MSQATATARSAARPPTRPASRAVPPSRPQLRVVSARHSRPQLRLAISAMALLGGGLVLLLVLNISLSRGSYELYQGELRQHLLAEQQQVLREQLMANQAPQHLARRARALGMVPAPNPAFVRLPDGSVVGVPAIAQAAVKPTTAQPVKATKKPTVKPAKSTKPAKPAKPAPKPTKQPVP
jgi:hypothetical protein